LFQDKLFYKVLGNTLYLVVFGIGLTTVVTIFIAVLLNNKNIKGLSFFRVVFFLPTLVPLVILAILWIWVLQPDNGIVNSFLHLFGTNGPGWFSSPGWAKPAFILVMIWGSGRMIIIYLAGLQGISASLYEAARIDGAGPIQQFFQITLPMLKPVILFNVITGIIAVLQQFAEAFIITDGGPDGSTTFYALYLYQNAFQYSKMGYASAMGWILFVIALVIMLVLFRLKKRWGYDG